MIEGIIAILSVMAFILLLAFVIKWIDGDFVR